MKIKALVSALALMIAMPFAQGAAFDFSCSDCPLDITSDGTPTVTSTINVGASGALNDINVFISIAHTFSADLDIFLTHDDTGTTVELATDNGGGFDDAYLDTTFDDAAAVNIADAATPFAGTFAPEGLLADFNGEDLLGSWTLTVMDDFTLDGGMVLDWGIFGDAQMAAVSEPGIVSLLGLGLIGMGIARRRRS